MNQLHLSVLSLCVLVTACAESDTVAEKTGGDPDASSLDPCRKDRIEDDLLVFSAKAVGGDAGAALPAEFVVSTTYLRLRPGDAGAARFSELSTPIVVAAPSLPGLLGLELGLSESCGVARTLSVWESVGAMYDFSTSDVHMQAVENVSDVSRGGSLVGHWDATSLDAATWEEAALQLAQRDGPYY